MKLIEQARQTADLQEKDFITMEDFAQRLEGVPEEGLRFILAGLYMASPKERQEQTERLLEVTQENLKGEAV